MDPPRDVYAALEEIKAILALNDSVITQLQESRDIAELARIVSMYGSIVNAATRLSVASFGNTSVVNMTEDDRTQMLNESTIRIDVSGDRNSPYCFKIYQDFY